MKTRLRTLLLFSCVLVLALVPALLAQQDEQKSAPAVNRNEKRVERLPESQKIQLQNLTALSVRSLAEIGRTMSPAQVEAQTREIMGLGNLSVGARPVDARGRAPIHRYLQNRIGALKPYGMQYLGSLKGTAVVPVAVDQRLDPALRETPSSIAIGDRSWHVDPLWPNGAMPSLCPAEGLEGQFVYVGRGEWDDLKGLDLKGSIALMKFEGGRNFERLFTLGCQAVVVMEDDHVNREKAEGLFCNTPVPFPRFYVNRQAGEQLRELATRKAYVNGALQIVQGQRCLLRGGNIYEARPYESMFAYLPPTPEVRYRVKPTDLLDRIAADAGVDTAELVQLNGLRSTMLKAGQKLLIPGNVSGYTVRKGDLLERIAADFSLTKDDIAKANRLKSEELAGGQQLTIPNTKESILIQVPIDSVSVAPDAPHGASVAANLAIAMLTMEHLAAAENVSRRKGVVFAFIDADTVGGLSSRAFAEQLLLNRKQLTAYNTEDIDRVIKRYREADAWFNAPDSTRLSEADAQWLGNEWLLVRLEDRRVRTAEERIRLINRLRTLPAGPEKDGLQQQVNGVEAQLQALAGMRTDTLENRGLSWRKRVVRFAEAMRKAEDSGKLPQLQLSFAGLHDRLQQELRQEVNRNSTSTNNAKVVSTVMKYLHPDGKDKSVLGWYFDFSSGSPSMGIKTATKDFRLDLPGAGNAKQLEQRYSDVASYACVKAGWPEEWTFLTNADKAEHPIPTVEATPAYGEFWAAANVALLPIGTYCDRQETLDTPHDLPEYTDFRNLAIQARTELALMKLGVESPVDSLAPSDMKIPEYGRVVGKTVQFNIRSGIDAQDPVPQTYVYYPGIKGDEANNRKNSAKYRGVRKGVMLMSLLNGNYTLPLETTSFKGKNVVYAYHLDRKSALFDKVVDQGQIGTQKKDAAFEMLAGFDVQKDLILTDVYPLAFFPEPDPVDYAIIGSTKDGQYLRVSDAVLNGEPQHYALVNPNKDYSETDITTNVLYMPAGRHARVSVQKNILFKMLLVGNSNERNLKGLGHLIGPLENGDRNLTLPLTTLTIAKEMRLLAVRRQQLYERYGITDKGVMAAIARSEQKIAEAEAAVQRKDWQAANGAAREAWGTLVKAYPRILTLGREAVFSVVVLMALLLPACVFLEKLLLGGKSVISQLVGTTILFIVGVVFLNYFHPAYQISVSPFIVMIAFTMILMSLIVLALSYQRFEVLVRRARSAGGEVESEEISLMSSLGTALSLGVSNLKKRPARTFLTTLTVSVLTFSIITFVSVKAQDTLYSRPISLDRDVEGHQVQPETPKYQGLLFRNTQWVTLDDSFVSAIYSEFGTRYEMTTRGYYIEVEGGNNADREGVNQIKVTYGKKAHILTGIMTFEPNEVDFSHLNEAVSNHQWFRAGDRATGTVGDRFTVILPDVAAKSLGITPDMLYTADGTLKPDSELPEVIMQNNAWRVIGILNTDEADRMRDLTGKSLAMVDYLRSAFSNNAASGDLINEPRSYHMSWRKLAIVPKAAADDISAKPRSVAIRIPKDEVKPMYADLALRLNRTMFGQDADTGKLSIITTKKQNSIGGLAKIIVPVILCILIVLNTMMGTVEERKGEVGMLGSIGLSPAQISFLLLSESTVFSVLGIIFGTFSGLAFAKAIPWLASTGHGSLSSLSFNFTSLSSMALAMGTGVVVLLATLIPARKAATLAAPSGMANWELPTPTADGAIRFLLPFTLTRGNAVGMMAFFRRFLLNHTEATSEDFNCRHIGVGMEQGEEAALVVAADMWLTPYDLDVAQHLTMRVMPTENEGVFGVTIVLQRTSGTEEAWLRTNYGFMNLVRHQFLLWRNLDNDSRMRYIGEGAQLFQEAYR